MKLGRLVGFLTAVFLLVAFAFLGSGVGRNIWAQNECFAPNITGGVHCPRGSYGCTDSDNHFWCCYVKDACKDPNFTTPTPIPSPPKWLPDAPVTKYRKNETFCGADGKPSADPADPENPEIYTALGCIPVRIDKFMTWLLPWVFRVAGGIAFLLMVGGFIQISASKGDPKAMQAAKETIGSALTGLLVCIFAIFILRLIAVDILHIPGMN